MNDKERYTQLNVCLKQDLAVSKKLLSVLKNEKECLDQNNHLALESFTLDKLTLMQQLSDGEIKRQHLLADMGYQASPQGLRPFIASLSQRYGISLINTWDELKTILTDIQQLHDINSRIITLASQEADRVLDVLLGRTNEKLYDAKASSVYAGKNSTSYSKA